jgi:hypothetical protein
MSFLNQYYNALNSKENLELFINTNFNKLYDYYGLLNHLDLVKKRIEFSELSLKANVVEELDYANENHVAYLNLLLKTSVRLGDFFVFQQFFRILQSKGLEESFLIKSASLFMSSNNTNEFINPYDDIIYLLEESFLKESDNKDEPISLLINYYSLFAKHFSEFANDEVKKLRKKINETFKNGTFEFVKDDVISEILAIDTNYSNNPYNKIQSILDEFLGRRRVLSNFELQFLLEEGTSYANIINSRPHAIEDLLRLNRTEYLKIQDDTIYNSLGRGTAILENEPQLLAYMYAFGKMHFAKLKEAVSVLPKEIENYQLIDWGCGQGPASKVFIEEFGSEKMNSLTLVEPSEFALKRASLHLLSDVNSITTICKDFDSLKLNDFDDVKDNGVYVHLFSNIIDVELFSLSSLIKLVKESFVGENYFVVVSPKINTTRTARINEFIDSIVAGKQHDFLLNEDKSRGSWIGNWSKVLRVFKVDI